MEQTLEVVKFENDLPAKEKEYQKEISLLQEKYAGLKLVDAGDKATANIIRSARIEVKGARVGVQKYCKQLRDNANAFAKAVIAKEKEILAPIEQLETYLESQEQIYINEQKRIADEKEAAIKQVFLDRVKALKELGAVWNEDDSYTVGVSTVQSVILKGATDEQYEKILSEFKESAAAVAKAIAEKEAAELAERERLEKQRAEQEAERLRLEAIAKEQADKQRLMDEQAEAIRKEQQRIEDAKLAKEREKQRIVEEKKREAELEQSRKEAAEQAIKDAEAKRLKEEEEAKERERIAAEKEKKRIERMPDKEKLKEFAEVIKNIVVPDSLKSDEARTILYEAEEKLNQVREFIINEANKL